MFETVDGVNIVIHRAHDNQTVNDGVAHSNI